MEQIGEDWQINFADTGPGMSRSWWRRFLSPSSRSSKAAPAWVLAIVYQIVQAHEGKVWARSKLGEGSVFVLRLRRAGSGRKFLRADCTVAKPQRPARDRGSSRGCGRAREAARMGNILVCDDERSICEMLDIALRREGHKVETVKSGERRQEEARQRAL